MIDKDMQYILLKNFIYDYLFEEYCQNKLRYCEFNTVLYIAIEQVESNHIIKQLKRYDVEVEYLIDMLSIKLDLKKYNLSKSKKLVALLDYIKKMMKQATYYEG